VSNPININNKPGFVISKCIEFEDEQSWKQKLFSRIYPIVNAMAQKIKERICIKYDSAFVYEGDELFKKEHYKKIYDIRLLNNGFIYQAIKDNRRYVIQNKKEFGPFMSESFYIQLGEVKGSRIKILHIFDKSVVFSAQKEKNGQWFLYYNNHEIGPFDWNPIKKTYFGSSNINPDSFVYEFILHNEHERLSEEEFLHVIKEEYGL